MALSIVNNPTAIGAQGSVTNANNSLAKTIKALSTGLRINTAADDASGLAVSEKSSYKRSRCYFYAANSRRCNGFYDFYGSTYKRACSSSR